MVAQEFIEQGHPIYQVLGHCQVARSSYYYCPKSGIQGRKPYAVIRQANGEIITEIVVLELINTLFTNPFVDYGYYKTYIHLNKKEHIFISKHATFSLMKRHNLLRNQYVLSSKKTKRNWVKELIPMANIPFSYLERFAVAI
jgi:putative transposase